ncbi:MAG TPA: hypothetical protein VH186_05930 [Chloroflexia bacterium]|nr:hypothetical protein [Chloroflexia bacterium]
MKSLKSALQLNVLIEMALGDCDFKSLLMSDPLGALQDYNSRMLADAAMPCTLPRMELEMLQRVAGTTSDFRQFCLYLLEERERIERIEEQRQHMEVLVPSGVSYYTPEPAFGRRTA